MGAAAVVIVPRAAATGVEHRAVARTAAIVAIYAILY